jgi:hypothetical protein
MSGSEYPYQQREAELDVILRLPEQSLRNQQYKQQQLVAFINDEEDLLASLGLPNGKNARLLKSAETHLAQLRNSGNHTVSNLAYTVPALPFFSPTTHPDAAQSAGQSLLQDTACQLHF